MVHSGELHKISKGHSQERHFFLFDNHLIYCKKVLTVLAHLLALISPTIGLIQKRILLNVHVHPLYMSEYLT